tara:strand:- start:750 stop:1178 length:429 start_codon:yes stop_codon:yes gene_type:complete
MKLIITILIYICLLFAASSNENNFYIDAKKLFEEKKFEESKFLFQRNIVYNPKDAKSYLYLAKIYKKENDNFEEEKNLNTTLLLEPRNEEAMYLLIDIELKRSNFSEAKTLNNDFKKICSSLCEKVISIENRLKEFEKKDAS